MNHEESIRAIQRHTNLTFQEKFDAIKLLLKGRSTALDIITESLYASGYSTKGVRDILELLDL